jgi:DNA-nicking Smr family endonuclease
MKAATVVPDCGTYSTLTSALAVAEEHELVDKLYSEALERGAIDPYTFDRMSGTERRRRAFNAQGTIIDLHDLNVAMALAAVRHEFHRAAEGKRTGPLQIVTGKGTLRGGSPVRNAVIAMLQELKVAHTTPPNNTGIVVV